MTVATRIPKTVASAQAQLARFEGEVVARYCEYAADRRRTQQSAEALERARDRLMLVKLTIDGEYGPTHAVGSNGSWPVDGDPLPLVERRRYFPSTDLGKRAVSQETLARAAAEHTNGSAL